MLPHDASLAVVEHDTGGVSSLMHLLMHVDPVSEAIAHAGGPRA